MANKIILTVPAKIKMKSNNINETGIEEISEKTTYVFPLQEDPKIEYQSQFTSLRDRVPQMLNGVVEPVHTFSQLQGQANQALTGVLDLLLWQKTEPVTMVFQIKLFAQENSIRNIWVPMYNIISMSIIHETSTGALLVPGIALLGVGSSKGTSEEDFLKNRKNLEKALTKIKELESSKGIRIIGGGTPIPNAALAKDKDYYGTGQKENPVEALNRLLTERSSLQLKPPSLSTASSKVDSENGRTVDLTIPGIIRLDRAIITKAIPTYSKEVTTQGVPLWCTLDVEIKGTRPATSQNIMNGYWFGTKVTDEQKYSEIAKEMSKM